MTKKHFIALADAIISANRFDSKWTLRDSFSVNQLEILADFCQEQNPQFNRERWIGYIKGENGKNGGKK